MQILTKIPPTVSESFAAEQFESGLYPLTNQVTAYVSQCINPGKSLVLFSGGHRLDFDAIYIEPKMFSNLKLQWKPQTLFMDPSNKSLINYTISKLLPSTLLILNTSIFIRYRSWQEIDSDIKDLKKYCDKIIVSLPINRFDFNRLKYNAKDIAQSLEGKIIEDTVVICR